MAIIVDIGNPLYWLKYVVSFFFGWDSWFDCSEMWDILCRQGSVWRRVTLRLGTTKSSHQCPSQLMAPISSLALMISQPRYFEILCYVYYLPLLSEGQCDFMVHSDAQLAHPKSDVLLIHGLMLQCWWLSLMYHTVHTGFVCVSVCNVFHYLICPLGKLVALLLAVIGKAWLSLSLICEQLWDTRTLTLLKTYVTERPVNAAAISPLLDHVWFKALFLQ